jgi:hypothetical protein
MVKTGIVGDGKLTDANDQLRTALDTYNHAVGSMTLRMVVKVHDILISMFPQSLIMFPQSLIMFPQSLI